jgi:hypothetical protein
MKSVCRLVLLLVLTSVAFMAYALPGGSYLQTCNNCSLSRASTGFLNLSCTCQDRNHNSVFSVLSNISQCTYVVNNNGQLYCQQSTTSPLTTNPLPPGSYMQTCQSCQFDGNQLSCQCMNKNQYQQPTSLYNAGQCSWIVNNNGYLQCGNQNNSQGLPPGSYSQTCQSCQFDGNQLSCQCMNKNQYQQPTSLYNAGQCGWIVNNNGYLYCQYQQQYNSSRHRHRLYP